MKPTHGWVVCVPVALVLALVLGLREPPRVAARPADTDPDANPELASVFDGTAIGVVIRANGNEVPKNGAQLMRALGKVGDFVELPVPFSAVALDSGLTNPRVVLAPRPRGFTRGGPLVAGPDLAALEAGGVFGFLTPRAPRANPPVPGAATAPTLEGRLFLAANMEWDAGELKVKTIEFISWNGRKRKFDFGVIACSDKEPELRVLDGVRCVACHKNKGPIFGTGPWSNTTNNDVVREAVRAAFAGRGKTPPKACDGMTQVGTPTPGEAEVIDLAVRQGSDLVRDREVYRAVAKTADGRKVLGMLLVGLVDKPPQTWEINQAYSGSVSRFSQDVAKILAGSSGTLLDSNPAGSVGRVRNVVTGSVSAWGGHLGSNQVFEWTGSSQQVLEYDERRAEGEHGVPSRNLPSNPRAFVRTGTGFIPAPAAVVNSPSLARAVGLTDGDLEVLARALANAARKIDKPKVTPAALAKEVFAGPKFADAIKTGDLPDREDFKERFVTGLADVAKKYAVADLGLARKDYASAPIWALTAGPDDREPALIPTTACLGCHDVQGPNARKAFNPIPALAFDPFDKAAREAWLKTADKKKKEQVLGRMRTRVATDQDMPPEDSAEYEAFRQKDPAAFDAVKAFLEAELAKVGK